MINNGFNIFPPLVFNCEQWQITNEHNRKISSSFKLYDFDGNNQNDIIRLIFTFAGISYKDKRVKQDEWERVKDRMPIQKLPLLCVNNQLKIYYLNSIVRYLAREFHLYGIDNNDQAIVDIIFELTREFQEKLFEQINHSNDKIILNQFLIDYGINYLNQLENFYDIFNRHGRFYLGIQISLADLIVYQTINYLLDIQSKLLDNYFHLQRAYYHLEKYFNKKRRFYHKHRSRKSIVSNKKLKSNEKDSTSTLVIKEDRKLSDRQPIPPLPTRQESKSFTIEPTEVIDKIGPIDY